VEGIRTAAGLKYATALILAGSASIVTTGVRGASIDQDRFPKRYPILLAFDLAEEGRPHGALIVTSGSGLPTSDINVGLPFKVLSEKINEKGLFRVGGYKDWTLVTFSNTDSVWPQAIDFDPEVSTSTEAYNASQSGGPTIYLISEGQIRRFRYRYPNADTSKSFASVPSNFQMRNPDAVALALPRGAQEFAVREGQLSIPGRLVPGERAFPAAAVDMGQQFLEIAYQVPATDFQKTVVKWGVKGLAAFVPIAGLFILRPDQVRNNKLRLALILGGGLLFFALLATIIWVAYTTTDSGDMIGELVLLIGSALISGGIFWSKSGEEDKSGAQLEPDEG
jgi:hypothetical protein